MLAWPLCTAGSSGAVLQVVASALTFEGLPVAALRIPLTNDPSALPLAVGRVMLIPSNAATSAPLSYAASKAFRSPGRERTCHMERQ